MNRLQLAQRVGRECGLTGAVLTSTVSQTGENQQIVEWVDDAWQRIQATRRWDWLWESTTVTITANTNSTAGSIAAARYERDRTFDSLGAPLSYLPWADFIQVWPAALIVAGTPRYWTIRPDKAFTVNAKPTSNTVLSVERYKNPTAMAANSDTPTGLPDEHHMVIAWRAVMLYAGHDEASALYQHANAEYKKIMAAMGATESAEIVWGASW